MGSLLSTTKGNKLTKAKQNTEKRLLLEVKSLIFLAELGK
jgi:hypothetical protein